MNRYIFIALSTLIFTSHSLAFDLKMPDVKGAVEAIKGQPEQPQSEQNQAQPATPETSTQAAPAGSSASAAPAANAFDPASVSCALDKSQYGAAYVGTRGDYEWKKGLNQISKSSGYFDVKKLSISGKDHCQFEVKQHQCVTIFLKDGWEKPFGTNNGDFSCINLRNGELMTNGEIGYPRGVKETHIKMRCPHSTELSECSNDSNSKRGGDFAKAVLKKNKWEMVSVCGGHIREPRYTPQANVGDTALCAFTNPNGEALYKVLIPMEYATPKPLKTLK